MVVIAVLPNGTKVWRSKGEADCSDDIDGPPPRRTPLSNLKSSNVLEDRPSFTPKPLNLAATGLAASPDSAVPPSPSRNVAATHRVLAKLDRDKQHPLRSSSVLAADVTAQPSAPALRAHQTCTRRGSNPGG